MTSGADRPQPRSTRVQRLVLLGHPVAHSLSPTFQNAALEAAGYPVRYEAVDVLWHELALTLGQLSRNGGAGNVTVPHKRAAVAWCDEVTELARTVGAINTFWVEDGRLHGDNTDVAGAAAALREVLAARGDVVPPEKVALLGAGGASAAFVAAVARVLPYARVVVWARRPDKAGALGAVAPGRVAVAESLDAALGGAGLVVNATPLGLRADDLLPCPVAALPPRAAVLDLVYGSDETAWVRAARRAGHVAADGLTMLVEQGAAAFERWFGHAPDRDAMWGAVHARTGRARPGDP